MSDRDNKNFQTQELVCHIMVDLIPKECSTILEPTPGSGNLVKVLRERGFNVDAPSEFWDVHSKYDAIVMNPPFSPMSEGYKILFACMELSNNIIALMPWLTLINSTNRTNRILDFGLKSITHLPRSAFAGSRVQTCVLEMIKGFSGNTIIRFAKNDSL